MNLDFPKRIQNIELKDEKTVTVGDITFDIKVIRGVVDGRYHREIEIDFDEDGDHEVMRHSLNRKVKR